MYFVDPLPGAAFDLPHLCEVIEAQTGVPRAATLWIVPRRARCTGCRVTHVLLPVMLLVRRADTAAVIGAGLTAKATGVGHRLIAAVLGRPAEASDRSPKLSRPPEPK